MKYLIDCHVFDEGGQGTATYIRGIYNEIIKKRTNDTYYLAAYNIDNLKNIFGIKENIEFVQYKYKNKFIRLLFLIPLIILKNKINVLHCQYFLPLFKISKEIVTIHDVLFLDYPEYFPLLYRIRNKILFYISSIRADLVLTVSEYSKERIIKHFKLKDEKIFVIPNGVDFNNYKYIDLNSVRKSIVNKKNFILYVSRIEKRKNHEMLVKAFSMSKLNNDYELILVGRDDLGSKELYKIIKNLDEEVKENIFIYSDIDDNELKYLYKECSLFIFPSLCEGFGIPPIEAIISGASTICAKNTAMEDFIFLGDRFFDEKNINDIILSMNKYIKRIDGIDIMQDYIKKIYNWDYISSKFISLQIEKGLLE